MYSYNRAVHRSHGMQPIEVKQQNSLRVFNSLYSDMLSQQTKQPRYKVRNFVRISKLKGKFEKGYEYRFQEEVY